MVHAANQSTGLPAPRLSAASDTEAALLHARCRCHGDQRVELDVAGVPHGHAAEPALAGQLLRPLLEHVRKRAQGDGALLASYADLARKEWVSLAPLNGMLREASRCLGDPGLGLSALEELQRGDGDTVELAAASAPTLDAALSTLIRHAHQLCNVAELHLYVERGRAALELRYVVNLSRMLRDFLLGALAQALRRWLDNLNDFEVWLDEPVQIARGSYVRAFAPASVRLTSPCDALVFPAARLAEAPRTADPALHAVLLRVLDHSCPDDGRVVPLSVRVRHAIGSRLSTGDGNAEGVARSLALSMRSLTRKLQEEGVTFSELLENVRRERAIHYVERSNLMPQQIAHLLGYSTTSAFCRAFARWFGGSALDMRRAAQARRSEL